MDSGLAAALYGAAAEGGRGGARDAVAVAAALSHACCD